MNWISLWPLAIAPVMAAIFGATVSIVGALRSRLEVIAAVGGLSLLLPLGTVVATPVSLLPGVYFTSILAFALVALLYLVTEELLVEAHEIEDTPLVTAMFFVGFLSLLVVEELVA